MSVKNKFFIGSSRKYMLFADALKELFNGHLTIEPITWMDHFKVRGGGNYTYESLLKAVEEYEFAVFFISKDWKLDNTKPTHAATPNVWFEAGMFMSVYGRENVLIIEEEFDHHDNEIQYLTDLSGLQPTEYSLNISTKNYLKTAKVIPIWDKLSSTHKKNILDALLAVKNAIEENINDDKDRVLNTVFQFNSRKDCYKIGEKLVLDAEKYVYSIVSYEDEYEDEKYPNGLLPYIEKRLEELKKDPGFTHKKSREFFKRYMNLANNAIAEQAKYILEKYNEYIEIKDTYCNFLEVLITEKAVLIVLPNPKQVESIIGMGVLIKSRKIAREFKDWFNMLIPEPNGFEISNVNKLEIYRQLEWNMLNKRMDDDNYRCNACYYGLNVKTKDQPNPYKSLIEEKLNKVKNEIRN